MSLHWSARVVYGIFTHAGSQEKIFLHIVHIPHCSLIHRSFVTNENSHLAWREHHLHPRGWIYLRNFQLLFDLLLLAFLSTFAFAV